MIHGVIMAGFGGQGVMLIGQLMTYGGMLANKHVSWIPSYGPEMRGGTANCSVIVSDEEIGSPVVTEPTAVIAMNVPSLDKFEPSLVSGGILVINSSLIERKVSRDDIVAFYVPANDIADRLGNVKVANMVLLGALLEATGAVEVQFIISAFEKTFIKRPELLEINKAALAAGSEQINKK